MLGYGIPDYGLANSILAVVQYSSSPALLLDIFPNPFENEITVRVSDKAATAIFQAELIDIAGKSIMIDSRQAGNGQIVLTGLDNINPGFYILKATLEGGIESRKILKK